MSKKKEYVVTITYKATGSVIVEAENGEEALKAAERFEGRDLETDEMFDVEADEAVENR